MERRELLIDPNNPSRGTYISRRRTDKNLERSRRQTHEAIVSVEMFLKVDELLRARGKEPKRREKSTNRQATTTYRFRGLIRCDICGRRMSGWSRSSTNQYQCRAARIDDQTVREAHPRLTTYLREDETTDLVDAALTRLFASDHLEETVRQLTAQLDDRESLRVVRLSRMKDELADARLRSQRIINAIAKGLPVDSDLLSLQAEQRLTISSLEEDIRTTSMEPSGAMADRIRVLLAPLSNVSRQVFAAADPEAAHRFYRAIGLELLYDDRDGMIRIHFNVGEGRGALLVGPVKKRA